MDDGSPSAKAEYFHSVVERLRVIANGRRYDLRRADQLRGLADGFDLFATRLEQEDDALPKP